MTKTKQLSLHGRLRMAAACPDANASLFAEAADAIEQHEAYKQEVSDAVEVSLRLTQGFEGTDAFKAKVILERFIIAKPDPLVEALDSLGLEKADEWAPDIRKALAARGLEIREKHP